MFKKIEVRSGEYAEFILEEKYYNDYKAGKLEFFIIQREFNEHEEILGLLAEHSDYSANSKINEFVRANGQNTELEEEELSEQYYNFKEDLYTKHYWFIQEEEKNRFIADITIDDEHDISFSEYIG